MGYQGLAWHGVFAERWDMVLADAGRIVEISDQRNFFFYRGVGRLLLGGGLTESDADRAIATTEEGYSILVEQCGGEPVSMNSVYGCVLGRALLEAGKIDAFWKKTDQVVAFARERGEGAHIDQVLWMQGMQHRAEGHEERAQACLAEAKAIAERTGCARMLERLSS